jgi:uncharacterized phage protein gp47/JayE
MSSNSLGATGLTIQTLADIISEILNGAPGYPGLKAIYGSDINVDPNSPDGQMANLYAQGKIDVLEMLQSIYDSFDPDQAVGVQLDERCAINGVTREPGTYTQQQVLVTAAQAVTLPGLDLSPTAPFTVADGNGNQYQLVATYSFLTAGATSLLFQAANMGVIQSAIGTITVPVTVLAGVTSVNNPAGPTTVGRAEETDAALRIRRANSVALPSKGWYQGLLAALIDVEGVTQAIVFENETNTNPDTNGVPAHSIWCVVAGGANADVAAAIYVKKNAGCGMKGSVSVQIAQFDGTNFAVLFDRPTPENLWFEATLTAISGALDKSAIAAAVLAQFGISYGINQPADTASIVAFIKSIAPNASVSAEGVSTDGSHFYPLVTPTGVNYQFLIPNLSHVGIF